MRRFRPAQYLTVLPFAAILLAQDAKIHTRVEDDGTGVRKVEIAADIQRKEQIKGDVVHLLPDVAGRRLDSVKTAKSFRIFGNIRFVRPAKSGLGKMEVERKTEFGGWPPVQTTYAYADEIKRVGYEENEAEAAAAPKSEYAYTVTMPGTIDETSIMPVGGLVDGQTVSWTMNAGKESVKVHVESMEPAWAPIVLISAILIVLIGSGLRCVLVKVRNKPRKI